MPAYHFTLHAYATWHPDHPEGWHQHGESTPLLPNQKLAEHRRQKQRWPAAEFVEPHHPALAEMATDICRRRDWRCHGGAITQTHIHLAASWHQSDLEPLHVQATLKRLLAWKIAQLTAIPGRRWFSDGGFPKPIADLAHLYYLLAEYFPNQGGHAWREAKR